MTTLMVAEKPKVAQRLAEALGDYSAEENRGVTNYVLETDEDEIIIAPAVGHIFTLEQKEGEWTYPVFDIEWVPSFESEDGADYIKKYYNNLSDVAERADAYINACDYDVEGCLPPDEIVLVRRNGTIERVAIGDLVDAELADGSREDGAFEYTETDIEIIGMDDWSGRFVDVRHVMRREAGDTLVEVTTTHGRTTRVTPNHPMLVATEDGLEVRDAGELEGGEFIPATTALPTDETVEHLDLIDLLDDGYVHGFKADMAVMPAEMSEHIDRTRKQCLNYRHNDRMPVAVFREIEEVLGVDRDDLAVSSPRGTTHLPARFPLDERFGRIVGLYLAEGCVDSGGHVGFYFGPEEDDLADEVEAFLASLGIDGKRRKRAVEGAYGDSECIEVGTKSRVFRDVLKSLGLGADSGSKRLPRWIMSAPAAFREGVLSGYWDGDGSVFVDERDDRAVAAAGSKSRALLDDLFLLLQGMDINASFQPWADREMTNLTVGRHADVAALAEHVGGETVQEALDTTTTGPNHDILETVPAPLAKRQTLTGDASRNVRTANRAAVSSVNDWEDAMESYPDGDVRFVEVTGVEEIENPHEYVYDVETETGNFMHGNGLISHNSVIGFTALRFIADAPDERIRRMKFSTLTTGDLQDAFDDLDSFDRGMTEAGLTRHILDWYYGINISRALMLAVRSQNRYKTLSTGRVQGPALKLLADREREIMAFDPVPYWEVYWRGGGLEAMHVEDRFWAEEDADSVVATCTGEDGEVVEIDRNRYKHNPPVPFNLTGLQREAQSQFGINPKRTQQVAQSLYEDSLISYPRTESQKLPPKIGFKSILTKLKKQDDFAEQAGTVLDMDDLSTRQGKKEDDAHPAIYPTGQAPSGLSKQEGQLYDLIVKRFFAVFGDAAVRETLTIGLDVAGERFEAQGKRTVERNWFDLYEPYVKVKTIDLPDVEKGQVIGQEELEKVDKETQPPNRYSQSSLVTELEKRNLGTKATRANVVDSLYNRNYIDGGSIEVTDLGLAVVDALEEHCPEILSEELTREFEQEMEEIREGAETKESVLADARGTLETVLERFREHQDAIGEALIDAIDLTRKKERELGACGECEDGTLRVIKTKKGSRFAGCSNYPDCENSFPLPRNGKIESLDELCDTCHTPRIKVIRKGKRPYSMCIDPDCPTKDDW